jgi:hypothetical protein
MRLDFALLAEAVTATEGKLYTEAESLVVPSLPVAWKAGFGARFTADIAERGEQHVLRIRGYAPEAADGLTVLRSGPHRDHSHSSRTRGGRDRDRGRASA